ncbi:equilibrative nucleoside transporter 2-like [Nerophis lumbriciformis]|uniref:equilibrative nucleoside transporter 2-like n=1 Tax=Nerophis lumbriciformis TaxID=546530 RepID=UPI003BAD50D9
MLNEKKTSAPTDRANMVAATVFLLGVGTLLPWNFFMTASQYFNQRLLPPPAANASSGATGADYNYDSWMALVSQLPLLLFTLLNSFLYRRVSERLRVAFSLVAIFLLFSLTAALVHVSMEPRTFFAVTMATIWCINMFSAVLQGSLFGLVGLLPPGYSTLFMSGQGLAGMFAAVAMLSSILGNPDMESAALGYFITPCVATLGTLLCYLLLPHLTFARFHLSRRDEEEETMKTKVLLSSADEKEQVSEDHGERSSVLLVFKKIWIMAACVTCVFAVTLSVFPAVTVRVESVYTHSATWGHIFTCVCCFIVFNAMDLLGRSAPSLAQWPPKDSWLFPAAIASRLVFVPLLMTCNIPHSKLSVFFRHDAAFATIMALFAFSNGYLASLCMAYAPQLVRHKDCETAGSLMTFFLVLGLAIGASLSFLLVKLL